jgi:hypothetical protein
MPLYRSHSSKYLSARYGTLVNNNLNRIRRPRDTDPRLHQLVGEWFKRKFGTDYRSLSLFCTGDRAIAAGYLTGGKALVRLIPAGDFRICFSPKCKDLFGHFQFKSDTFLRSEIAILKELDSLDFVEYENDGLELACESGNEVMVVAHSFRYEIVI